MSFLCLLIFILCHLFYCFFEALRWLSIYKWMLMKTANIVCEIIVTGSLTVIVMEQLYIVKIKVNVKYILLLSDIKSASNNFKFCLSNKY